MFHSIPQSAGLVQTRGNRTDSSPRFGSLTDRDPSKLKPTEALPFSQI